MSVPTETSDQSLLQRIQGRPSAACEGRLPPGALSMLSRPPFSFCSAAKRERAAPGVREKTLCRAPGLRPSALTESPESVRGKPVQLLPAHGGPCGFCCLAPACSARQSSGRRSGWPLFLGPLPLAVPCWDVRLTDTAAHHNGRSWAVPVFENLQNPLIQNREP